MADLCYRLGAIQLSFIHMTSARIALLQAISTFGKGTVNSIAALDKGCYAMSMPPRCKGAAKIIALSGTALVYVAQIQDVPAKIFYQLFE